MPPKKRKSTESNNKDDQTNEGSEPLFQRQGNDKRARFDSVSDTTLEDLPIELLECILVKVVAMEVKALKLAKSVWEEKADLVINRLGSVCPQWNSILTTNYFRKKLHRTFASAQQTIRLEIVLESTIKTSIESVTSLKDDVFILSCVDEAKKSHIVEMYKRTNMTKVKDVIPLLGATPYRLRGCDVSDCVYVLLKTKNCHDKSVLRIYKDARRKLDVAPWKYDHKLPLSMFSVCANGNLLVLSLQKQKAPDFISIYDPDGSKQHQIMLPRNTDAFGYYEPMQRSNGNLVVGYVCNPYHRTNLLEINLSGSVLRHYVTSLNELCHLNFAAPFGRTVITEPFVGMELLDSEFNLLGTYSLVQDEGKTLTLYDLHYEIATDEIVRIHYDTIAQIMVLTIFRFTEE